MNEKKPGGTQPMHQGKQEVSDKSSSMMHDDGFDQHLTPESTDMIGKQLRKVYSDMIAEPLPDRFADLLKQLSSVDSKNSGQNS
ncbi:MAG: NepR family anti-sigma factor [Beijerinckiaceae bacterium]